MMYEKVNAKDRAIIRQIEARDKVQLKEIAGTE